MRVEVIVTYRNQESLYCLSKLNRWLCGQGAERMVWLDDEKVLYNNLISTIHVGGYQNIDVDSLLQIFAWDNWSIPEKAQIMYRYENDDTFSIYTAASLRTRYPKQNLINN